MGIDWEKVTTTEELLEARFWQLARQDEMREIAFDKMMRAREESVRYWDELNAHRLRGPLAPGTLVLTYNKSLESQWGKLFAHRWNGPFRIRAQHGRGAYALEELDGTPLKFKTAACFVKRFYPRGNVEAEDVKQASDEDSVVSEDLVEQQVSGVDDEVDEDSVDDDDEDV